tara:strand:+ start:7102 stop:11097 length:3996 start_codon:yes stop_codon:yes gene_type:complete
MQNSLKNKFNNLSPEQIRKLVASRNRSLKTSASKTFEKMLRNPEEHYPLSKAQERIWFLSYLFKNTSLYNIPVAVKIYKAISLENLELALEQIVVNNDILRTTFHEKNGEIYQHIHPKYKPSIDYQDISNNIEKKKLIEEIALGHSSTTFNLTQLPLFAIKLIKIAENKFILLLNLQHIISDGWTNALLSNDLHLDYRKLNANSEKPYSYIDFVKWEHDWMKSETYQDHIGFWKRKLSSLPPASRFPRDFYSTKETLQGELLVYNFPLETSQKITAFCQRNNYTQFQFYYVCFVILMSIYTQENDIIIGTPVANRNSRYFQDTYGLFFNSLPIRLLIDVKLSFFQLMKKSIDSINQYIKHQEVPFTEIIKAINPERNLDDNVLFNIHFAYQYFPKKNKEDKYEMLSIDYGNSKFDLNFWVEVEGENTKLVLTYKKDSIASSKIVKCVEHYQNLIDAVIENPTDSLDKQKIFPDEDLSLLTGPVEVHSEESWLELFNKALEEFPNKIAVIDSDEKITYKELNKRANALTQLFREKGVKEHSVVILDTGRNVSFIIGILACYKSACTYLPVALDTPEEKLHFIIKDSQASVLFSDKKIISISCISPKELAHFSFNDYCDDVPLKSNTTAYLIYTSGTTSKPKGVLVSHGALLNYTKGLKHEVNRISLQNFAHVSAIQADLGNTAIFLSLGYGGTLLFPSQDVLLDPALLCAFFKQNPPDILKIVPSHLEAYSEIIQEILPSKVLICGGEVITNTLVSLIQKNKLKGLRVLNHYGPTETTIGVLTHELDLSNLEGRIPIGRPINNTKVYLLDAFLNLVPNGVEGEICISGYNLAKKYLNDSELTNQKYLHLPNGDKIYRTGDRGILNKHGEVIFLGRSDSQIKMNGFRVELREIESVLKNHPDVDNAVVYLLNETDHIKKLGAAIQTTKDMPSNKLATYLKKYVPDMFVPTFYFVKKIPLTTNGKIDYGNLKEKKGLSTKETIEILPRDFFEIKLLEFYKELFPNITISIEDNFFDIGGHSLLAIKLISKINKEFKCQLAISNLFNNSSIKELAGLLRKDSSSFPSIENPIAIIEKGHLKKSIWVHPAGGNIMCYYPIATALSPIMNTYSFGCTDRDETISIEKLASDYFKKLKQGKITEHLILAGWSMGALIAHQIACLFALENSTLPPLVLLDQPAISNPQKEEISYKERLFTYLQKVYVFTNQQFDKKIIESDVINHERLLNEFIRIQLTPEETTLENFKGFLDILVKHNEIVTQFSPELYNGPVLLLKAKENLMVDEHPITQLEDLGWRKYCSNITIVEVPGNHITMINGKNSVVIANVVEQWLKTTTWK